MNNLLDAKWSERLAAYAHLYVGYSGGLDSTVLLESLATCPQLKHKITAVHVQHGLSPKAQSWLVHCQQNCQRLGLHFVGHHVHIQPGSNLEERARMARYAVFKDYLQAQDHALLFAHHQNDQSETLLLNIFRGAGLEGLCAMPEEREFEKGVLLRPFLQHPRERLFQFAKMHGLQWVEDEMNAADAWSRTYLRQHILPKILTKWPQAVANLATTAHHCQQVKRHLAVAMGKDLENLHSKQLRLQPHWLENKDRLIYVLRAWLKQHVRQAPSTKQMQQILATNILLT